jgi:hypothetical protein
MRSITTTPVARESSACRALLPGEIMWKIDIQANNKAIQMDQEEIRESAHLDCLRLWIHVLAHSILKRRGNT